ncbi:ETC complex I subunit [Bartonella sp. TP]|uniref:ETC complex I subunit n=1 Tax=Bartonella sp. TP TaxID=3057550 RepID=UPI0025AED870|nr:ETC complex I subunit [Bartonella sp. TP]MDN5249528.1 ETC complex I subunit [Alphaproteobacteria bacterium]WJW79896.1 ETC complex I subunit [Bartonella sp. TP]
MLARIYSPAKNAMQAGKANNNKWILEYIPDAPKMIEPLMGYTSSDDMLQQIKLFFATKEEAVAYAQRENIDYTVEEKPAAKISKKSYGDNFAFDRTQPWTH